MSEQPATSMTFASLSVILLTMFVLLNALATRDLDREEEALAAIHRTFNPGRLTDTPNAHAPSRALDAIRAVLERSAPSRPMPLAEGTPDAVTGTFSQNELFVGAEDQISAPFLATLTTLADTAREYHLTVEIVAHGTIPPIGVSPSRRDRSVAEAEVSSVWVSQMARAASVARIFLDREFDPMNLTEEATLSEASSAAATPEVSAPGLPSGAEVQNSIALTFRSSQ